MSIARRLVKEVAHYEAETKKDEARVEAMRADPTKDEYDVKKMLEVVEESRMMIPDATRRLGEAINELFSFMEDHHETKEVLECEWYAEATALLEKSMLNLEPAMPRLTIASSESRMLLNCGTSESWPLPARG